jgi:hypothetical protein
VRLRPQKKCIAIHRRRSHAAVIQHVDGQFLELATRFDDRRLAILIAEIDAAVCVDWRRGDCAADAFFPNVLACLRIDAIDDAIVSYRVDEAVDQNW